MSRKLTIMPSRHSATVMEGETLLDAALREGYTLPYGCRNGSCSECLEVRLRLRLRVRHSRMLRAAKNC